MKIKFKSAFSLIELSVVILVIGILVVGITTGSRIISEAKIKSARALTKSSPVNSINDLVLWNDSISEDSFSNSSTIEDGTTVNTWQSLNPQTATKNNLIGAAIYLKKGINGLPTMQFNNPLPPSNNNLIGSSHYFNSSQNVSSVLNITYFMVLKTTDVTSSNIQSLMATDGAWVNGCVHFFIQSNVFAGVTNNEASDLHSSSISSGKVYMVTFRVINDISEIFINGVSAGSRSSGLIINNKNMRLNIGYWNEPGNNSTNARLFNGQIGEIIAFKRGVTETERQAVESYLKAKWGI